jgi:AcrR family transcriptional regulator
MAQRLKPDVQDRIVNSALMLFAQKKFRGVTMAQIASGAGLSTGNLYRYYRDKSDLFHALIPKEFVATLLDLMRRRIRLLQGLQDVGQRTDPPDQHLIAEELLDFFIEHRYRVVILLGKSHGTKYEGFANEISQILIMLALAHFQAAQPYVGVSQTLSFSLDRIYQNFASTIVNILRHFTSEVDIRDSIEYFSKYHTSGIRGLFSKHSASEVP